MSPHSLITGTGLVTALGSNLPSTWAALMDGRFIRAHTPAMLDDDCSASRVVLLAEKAAREAVAAAGWSQATLCDASTAILLGTSKGDITGWLDGRRKSDNPEPAGWTDSSFGLAGVCDDLCVRLGRPAGPRLTISAACASGLHALIRADLMLRGGEADRALVVATEASLHPLFLASFDRLGILAQADEPGRPFDVNRSGFRMSEASAAITLERTVDPERNRPAVAVTFTALACDGDDLIAGDRTGATTRRLLSAAIGRGPVDVIHAHGTGTVLNDAIELAAIESALGDVDLATAVYSHKGSLGHTLGAAGLVSTVLAVTAQQVGKLPPMPTTQRPLTARRAVVHAGGQSARVDCSIVIASGFGTPHAVIRLDSSD